MSKDSPALTPEQQGAHPPWKPGQSGNPKGREKGSRNKLGEKFLANLVDHWETNGVAALDACLKDSPSSYVKVVASILPKEMTVKVDLYEDLSDAELDSAIKRLARTVLGIEGDGSSEGDASEDQPTESLPTLQ